MKTPPYLNKGDKVAVISTARKITKDEMSFALKELSGWDLNVILGKHLFDEENQFAGTDSQRAADLQEALDDGTIKAIICARGGYGTVRIVERIDFSNFTKKPKWVVGYSDVTVLHNEINQVLGVSTIHGTMPINFESNSKEALLSLKNSLFGESLKYNFDSNSLNRSGNASGQLIGGNLSIIYSLLGSRSQIDTNGKILFLEDLDEYLYHIDRMMMSLKRAGMLTNLAGLVVGAMTDMKDNNVPFGKTAEEIIADAVKEYSYPICFGFTGGHINDNRTLVLGREVKLKVGETVELVL